MRLSADSVTKRSTNYMVIASASVSVKSRSRARDWSFPSRWSVQSPKRSNWFHLMFSWWVKQNGHDPTIDSVDEAGNESPSIGAGLRERVRRLLNSTRQRGPGTKQESAKDRTRSLVLLIGGTVGAVLVFMGVFSTPTTLPNRETSGRASANLGRPIAPNQATATQGL